MSDSNPFDDLAEEGTPGEEEDSDDDSVVSGSEATIEDSFTDTSSSPTTTFPDDKRDSSPREQVSERSKDVSVDGPTLANSSPPFPYTESAQRQMYVPSGLWDDFEDHKFDAELELRRTFEVRNVQKREIDTAVTRLVLENFEPTEIAEMVIQMRGFEPSELQ